MNKKRSKVQGGWAKDLSSGNRVRGTQSQKPESIPSEGHSSTQTFTYEHVTLKKEPIRRTIDQVGEYVISTEPNEESKITLEHDFLDEETRSWMFEQLKTECNWQQLNVRDHVQPRLTAWVADCEYSYSGVTHQKAEWTPLLKMLKEMVESKTGKVFNSVFANLYRDGHDSVAWHSDDEKLFGAYPCIASLSFGDQRTFEMRRKPFEAPLKHYKDLLDDDYLEYIKIPLFSGSFLLMEGASQLDWQHRVPREYHDRGPRINLTFRLVVQ